MLPHLFLSNAKAIAVTVASPAATGHVTAVVSQLSNVTLFHCVNCGHSALSVVFEFVFSVHARDRIVECSLSIG